MKRFVCLALTLVAACGSPSHLVPPKRSSALGSIATAFTGRGPKVVILGDSLTLASWDDLYDALDGHYEVEIGAWFGEGYAGGPASDGLRAKFGAKTPLLMRVARRYARAHPAVAVLALGTNDAWRDQPVSRALANMRSMVSEMRPACLVGVTLPAHSIAHGWSEAEADKLNVAMRSWANRIVDWATLSRRPGVLSSDGIHTTPVGTKLHADAIAEAVRNCKQPSGSN